MLAENHAPPVLQPAKDALFLDFDGTLVGIAPRPDAIDVPGHLGPLLSQLHDMMSEAVAIVSGRALAELEHYLPDFPGAFVGSHGAERRGAPPAPLPDGLDALHDSVRAAAEEHGVLAEIKTRGAALHFRQTPERKDAAGRAAEALADLYPGFVVQPAKMAFELKPSGATKDSALADLMAAPPFAGRRPVYLGDDATDEPALGWVAGRDGLAIKVGEGASVAPHRLATPQDVLGWLARALEG